MALVTKIPATFDAARTILEQQSKVIGVLTRNSQGTRRRPEPPRSLVSQPASLGAVLTWNAPVKTKGVVGFRIYKDTETNLLEEVRDPARRQFRVVLPANTKANYYVSTFTSQNAESPKIPVLVSSNTDQLATAGSGTNGSQPSPPPSWGSEPSGGNVRGRSN